MPQSIKELVQQNEQAIAIKAISEKIFSKMGDIRNSSTDTAYQRRWIWELLQNAMDTTNSERETLVEIEIDEKGLSLSFKHNGNPFKVDNITYLVNQQSSKPRKVSINERKRTIGKFGTGFITTHLLSEKVTLKSIMDAEELGKKHFELLIDRSGEDEDELYEGVEKAMTVLRNLDNLPNVENYDSNELNTEFVYHLNKDGLNVAKVGIDDLGKSLPFTMAFVKTISQVTINENLVYTYNGAEEIEKDIYLNKIYVSDQGERYILTIESSAEDATIGVEIKFDGTNITLIPLDEQTPKLFCNYPFIGTEEFNIPVIFNSSSFNIYQERRNGIILKETNTEEIRENKQIILECKNLFLKLLDFVSQNKFCFRETHVLANIRQPYQYEWLSKIWYDANILKPIQKYLLSVPFVEVNGSDEKVSILDADKEYKVWFPSNGDEEILKDIWQLASNWLHYVPNEKQYQQWNEILFEGCPKLTIYNTCVLINSESLDWLSNELQAKNRFFKNNIEWLNKLYEIINADPTTLNKINTNKIAILPNQKGEFVMKSQLSWDEGDIPAGLKDILNELGIDCRKKLLHYDVYLEGDIAIEKEKVVNFKTIVSQIKEQVAKHNSERMKGIILPEGIKNAFKNLYLWLVANSHAGSAFGELYDNKETRLLDEDTIKNSLERDNKTQELFDKYGVANHEELEKLIEKGKKERKEINPDALLISLGITSVEDLEKAKIQFADNKDISEALKHFSSADIEKLEKILKMIERAKKNVKDALSKRKNYDSKNWIEESLTTISGIKKNGIPIKIVVRPGDGEQIILFYPEEYQTLEDAGNELWYDKETEQETYSFGRFLKRTKTNRMPL